ncbi:SGNH/GDSL hydrolase family protein [Streptosporangium sp. NPDC051022]|uniref:SGNH/GDSL hydrolase family protein n=1 Tax=Streptosporangium sp. NPDC051022 TaxID=3155752 RepID=UPI00342990BB
MSDLPVRLAHPLTLLLAPVLAVQGLRVRRGTPRLPEAAGARAGTASAPGTARGAAQGTEALPGTAQGTARGTARGAAQGTETVSGAGAGEPLRVAVLGESTAAGVGVTTHEEGLAGCLARALAVRAARPVSWQVAARSGINTRATTAELVPLLESADAVVAVLGVNELLELNWPSRFGRQLRELVGTVRGRIPGVPIVVTGMPPVSRFPALPQPLRAVMGLRARALDRVMRETAADVAGVTYAAVDVPAEPAGFFARDGFHPSARGYEVWAGGLAEVLSDVLTHR